jgi:hypothetical protein
MTDPDIQEKKNKDGDEYCDDPVHSLCSYLLKKDLFAKIIHFYNV